MKKLMAWVGLFAGIWILGKLLLAIPSTIAELEGQTAAFMFGAGMMFLMAAGAGALLTYKTSRFLFGRGSRVAPPE